MQPPGISINANDPLWSGSTTSRNITAQVTTYAHTIQAVGGYWSASFLIRGDQLLLDDWIQDGLGRHVEVYDHSLTQIWEGFVNRMVVNCGPLSVTRGPLMNAANRVDLVYSTLDYTTDPPTVGGRENVGYTNDTDSQTDWGILPKVLTTGGVDDVDAAAILDTYLAEHAQPETSKAWRNDAATDLSITVECLGYVHWLDFPYNSTTSGEQNASAKITAVVGGTPNSSWLTYGTTHIDSNTYQVAAYDDEDKIAWNIIKETVARGDASANRWTFGVYANRAVYYEAAPTTVEYQQRLGDPKIRVETVAGQEVYPWNVLPAKWLLFPDFLVGKTTPSDLRDDPRAMFIESVTYRAPWGLDLTGGSVETLPQLLAQFGLSGVGA